MTKSDASSERDKTSLSFARRLNRFQNLAWQGVSELSMADHAERALTTHYVVFGDDEPVLRNDDTAETVALTNGALTALATEHGPLTLDIVLLDDACIDLSFRLPDALLPEMRQIIENEIKYRSPFNEDACVSIWVAEEQADGSWRARASVLLKSKIEPVLALLAECDCTAGVVRRAGKAGGYAAEPTWAGHTAEDNARFSIGGLPNALKLSLAGAVIFCASAIASAGIDRFTLSQVNVDAVAARATLAAQAQSVAGVRALDASLAQGAAKLAMTGRLSELLPDGVWLDQLIIDDDSVTLVGFGPSAADITRILAALPQLSDIRFASPVTRDNSQGLERFRIVATLGGAQS